MSSAENINKEIRKNALIKGLIFGAIFLASTICSYYLIIGTALSMGSVIAGQYFFSMIIPIVITIVFCLNMRKKLGGYWTFRQAVTSIFIMFITCYVILTIGRDVLFVKLVEPNMTQKTEAVMLDRKTKALNEAGLNPKERDAQVAELKKEFDAGKNQPIGSIIFGFVVSILLLFALSLIFAAMFKKEPPVTAAAINDGN